MVVNFSAAVPGGGNEVGYTWSFGDGMTGQGSSSRTHTYTVHGLYPVTLEASADRQTATATVEVTA